MATWDEVLAYCLAKPGAWRDEPWGGGDVVVKVGPKIFVFVGAPGSAGVTVKCGHGREEADEWIARFPDDVRVSPYIGRSGWNVLATQGSIPLEEVFEAIDESYSLVVAGLTRKHRPPMA